MSQSLRDLLLELEQGRYALPEIQRPFVWNNRQVKELIESIYEWYPIGSIIVWNMPRELIEDYGDMFRPLIKELETRTSNFQFMVIDGQQRLVSLLLAKRGTITIEEERKTRERRLNLYFNPLAQEKFLLSKKSRFDEPEWYKVSDLLDEDTDIDELLDKKGIDQKTKRKLVKKGLEDFRRRVMNYQVNIYKIPQSYLKYERKGRR